jgi:hypothetical protein
MMAIKTPVGSVIPLFFKKVSQKNQKVVPFGTTCGSVWNHFLRKWFRKN